MLHTMAQKLVKSTSANTAWQTYLTFKAKSDRVVCAAAELLSRSMYSHDAANASGDEAAELLGTMSDADLQQLTKLLEAQARYVKPTPRNVSFTAQVWRRHVLERAAPVITSVLMRRRIASSAESPLPQCSRRRMGI